MMVDFFLVDVFTDTPLTGNPLAVVPDAEGLADETMRKIAREFNQAETTFLLRPTRPGAEWRLRSFTPNGTEVGGAGHNALGAWWWLAEAGRLSLDQRRTTLTQEIGDRFLPVDLVMNDGRIASVEMTQSPPIFGAEVTTLETLGEALRLRVTDLVRAPLVPQVVSTGAAHLMVPVVSRDVVRRAAPDAERLAALMREVDGEGCYVFALNDATADPTAYARFFSPAVGIVEDIATGTAAGPLACYLIARGVVPDGSRVVVEQGAELQRPSRLEVLVRGDEVRLAGRGFVAAEGKIRVNQAS